MAKAFEFSILAKFRDIASRGLNSLRRNILGVGKAASNVGGGQVGASLATGGPIGGLILGGLVGAVKIAKGLLGGLIGVAKGVVSGIVRAFRTLVSALASIFRSVVSTVTGILSGLVRTAGLIGLGMGAAIAWQLVKGIKENMQLADIRAVLQKLLGDLAKDAEDFARQLSLTTPFTPMQMLGATAGLAAVQADYRKFLNNLADWAAGAKRPLEEIVGLFQRAKTGQFGEAMQGARQALISLKDLQAEGATFNAGGAFQGTPDQFIGYLMSAVERRFGGMAEQSAEVGSGPLSTYGGAIQALRVELTEPWYERFNQGLIDLNTWLLELAKTEKWETLIDASTRWSDALDRGIRRTLEWLTTRDWSFDNLKAGLAGLADAAESQLGRVRDLFAFKDAEGAWGAGPMTDALVAGFRWAAGEIEAIFLTLWDRVGVGLVQALARAMVRLAGNLLTGLNQAEERMREDRARDLYTENKDRVRKWHPDVPNRHWEELPEDEKEKWRNKRNARLSRTEQAPFDVARGGLGVFGEIAAGLSNAGQQLSNQAAGIEQLKEQTKERGDVAVEALVRTRDALWEIGQQMLNMGGQLVGLRQDVERLKARVKTQGQARS